MGIEQIERIIFCCDTYDGEPVTFTYLDEAGEERVVVCTPKQYDLIEGKYLEDFVTSPVEEDKAAYVEALEHCWPRRFRQLRGCFGIFHLTLPIQGDLFRGHTFQFLEGKYFRFDDFDNLTEHQLWDKLEP